MIKYIYVVIVIGIVLLFSRNIMRRSLGEDKELYGLGRESEIMLEIEEY